MPYLNGDLFLLILVCCLFLLAVLAALYQETRLLRTDPTIRGLWIVPAGGMVAEIFGVVARRHRYRKSPSPSLLSVGLDRRNRETEEVKRKPKARK